MFKHQVVLELLDKVSKPLKKVKDSLKSIKKVKVEVDGSILKTFFKKFSNRIKSFRPPQIRLPKIRLPKISIRGIGGGILNLFNKQVDDVKRKISSIRGKTIEIIAKLRNVERIKKQLRNIRDMALAIGTTLATLGLPILKAVAWEKDFIAVKKLFKGTDAELKEFETTLLNMSKIIPKTAKDLAIIAASGLQSGVDTKDIEKYTELVSKASVGFDMMADVVGDSFAKIKTQMGFSIDELSQYADTVNWLADNTASSAKDILNVTQRIAGSMASVDFSIEDVSAIASIGVQFTGSPEVAGTATNRIITQLKKNVEGAFSGLKTDGLDYYVEYLEKLGKLDFKKQFAEVTKVFGDGEASQLVMKSIKQINALKLTIDVSRSKKALQSLEREFKNVTSTVASKWQLMQNSMNVAFIEIGKITLPILGRIMDKIRPIVDSMSSWIKENKQLVTNIMKVLTILTLIIGVLIALKIAFLVVGFAVSGIVSVFAAIGAVIGALSLPVLALIGVIALIVVKWDEFKQAFRESIGEENLAILRRWSDSIGRFISALNVDSIIFLFSILKGAISEILEYIGTLWDGFEMRFSEAFGTENMESLKLFANDIGRLFTWVGEMWTAFVGLFANEQPDTELTKQRGLEVMEVVELIGFVVGKLAGAVVQAIQMIRDILTYVKGVFTELYDKVAGFFNYVISKAQMVKGALSDMLPSIPDFNISGKIKSIVPDSILTTLGLDNKESKKADTSTGGKGSDMSKDNSWKPKRLPTGREMSVSFEPIQIENNANDITTTKSMIRPKRTTIANKGN